MVEVLVVGTVLGVKSDFNWRLLEVEGLGRLAGSFGGVVDGGFAVLAKGCEITEC